MGKTKYPDTNNQFAYRTNREAFLKGIRDRAEVLWLDGYRVQPSEHCDEPNTFLVVQEGQNGGYKVNPVAQTCTCRFCTEQYTDPLDPEDPGTRVPCKHLMGLPALVQEELSYWMMLYKAAAQKAGPMNHSGERSNNYLYFWNKLSTAWADAEESLLNSAL